ncbi:hypothetical protein Tco_0821375 [Tanacetum coccineum]|uniref:Uncharacterized protein n=1 Tax=Tanacetum coccineum TaxID=301880 RepID=A0ABQ5ACZ8_9ASTR
MDSLILVIQTSLPLGSSIWIKASSESLLVYWRSKKRTDTAMSSAEAEYVHYPAIVLKRIGDADTAFNTTKYRFVLRPKVSHSNIMQPVTAPPVPSISIVGYHFYGNRKVSSISSDALFLRCLNPAEAGGSDKKNLLILHQTST